MDAAICTIVAKPHLAQARVLARSVRAHHPDLPVFVLLADEVEGCFDPAAEPFTLVRLADLPVPALEQLRFRHAQQPLSYACTPHVMAHLLECGFRRVLFLKQETMVLAPLDALLAPLAEAPVVLTPHLTEPPEGSDASAREVNVLLSGVYNVGVVGVSARPVARAFLSWWQHRLATACRHDVPAGVHFEQRWADLALSFFDGVRVLRDPVFNVGHWALPDRRITVDASDRVFADGRPVVVFRFSGFDPDVPGAFTRYNRRVDWRAAGDAHLVFDRFRRALNEAGLDDTRRWPYAYGRFDNGVPVPDIARELYTGLGDQVSRFGDPLRTAGPDSFWQWLRGRDAGVGVSRVWHAIYRRRPDLQRAFPDLTGAGMTAFRAWTRTHGGREHHVPDALLDDGAR
jgi:hypothetical protein